MALTIRKLSPAIGAEIQDIDLNEDQSAETINAINQIWFDNIILLFRGQNLSAKRQTEKRRTALEKIRRVAKSRVDAGHHRRRFPCPESRGGSVARFSGAQPTETHLSA